MASNTRESSASTNNKMIISLTFQNQMGLVSIFRRYSVLASAPTHPAPDKKENRDDFVMKLQNRRDLQAEMPWKPAPVLEFYV